MIESEEPIPTAADRNLQARENHTVYQAARDQHIYYRETASRTPSTLPRGTATFVGRDQELRALVDAVRRCVERDAIIPIFAIEGMPGVGKTALAVHAAHLLRDQFTDGHFFIDLHAHTAGRPPVSAEDALFALLSASGVKPPEIPASVDARAALWRNRLASAKVLLIIDNAMARAQVQPLLPGTSQCLVIITSRRRLAALSAYQAAVTLRLATLPSDDATTLFSVMAGRQPQGTEVDAVKELVRFSGYLPLAICLLAARLRPEPQWLMRDLLDELGQATDRLAHMKGEDVAVEAVFDLSYRRLPSPRRRFFRRLSVHPGPELDRYAAAALNGITPARAEEHLDALYYDNLIDQPTRGRYRMHDLIGAYASRLALSDAPADRQRALANLLDYYQSAALTANHQLSRRGSPHAPVANPSSALPTMATRQQALGWLNAEKANLLTCAKTMYAIGERGRLTTLASAMATYLRHAGPWEEAAWLHKAAATAAQQTGDQAAEARANHELGVIRRLMSWYAEAESALRRALDTYERIDDRSGIAAARTQLAAVQWRTGDHRGAATQLSTALEIFRSTNDLEGQADTLDELGVVRHLNADYEGFAEVLRQALAIHEQLGDLHGAANALNQLGMAQQLTDEYPKAIGNHERALLAYRQLGDRHGEARALNYLGIAYCQIGNYDAAKSALLVALRIHHHLGSRLGEANSLDYLGIAYRQTGDYETAEQYLHRALIMYQEQRNVVGEAETLNQFGVLRRLTGDYSTSAEQHERALALFQSLADHLRQAEVLNNLGALFLAQNQPARALDHYRRALVLARQARNPMEEANALEGLGRCVLHLGGPGDARDHLQGAMSIYERIGARDAANAVASLISGTDNSSASRQGFAS
ncbi:tetratricopeptide repeat protein [Actinomycetes bacterium KLBMP 9797]